MFSVVLGTVEGTSQLYFLKRELCAQMNQKRELWQDILPTVFIHSTELQITFHWEVFAFYCTALKKSIVFVLVVQCFIEKCSLGARNCCYLIKGEHSGCSSCPSKCFWSKSHVTDPFRGSPACRVWKWKIIPVMLWYSTAQFIEDEIYRA